MSRRLLLWQSVLAGLQVVAGTAAVGDLIGARWWAMVAVVVGAAQVSTQAYTHGLMTPVPTAKDVASRE